MRDRCRRCQNPDGRRCVPALVVVAKTQDLTERDIDGCSDRKRGGNAAGRVRPDIHGGQQRRHDYNTGMGDADRMDIVEIERMTGNRVQERGLFGTATFSSSCRDCRSARVKRRQPANHRFMPPAIDGGYGILNAKRGLLGVCNAQPVRRGDEPRQTDGEIADHPLLSLTLHIASSRRALSTLGPTLSHICVGAGCLRCDPCCRWIFWVLILPLFPCRIGRWT